MDIIIDNEKEVKFLENNVEIILPKNCISEKLVLVKKENRQLRIKLGFDPTSPDLHLGHAVVLRKLKEFQDLGHDIFVIVGDFTASIGDPTGKNKTRPPLTENEIKINSETYINQLGKILDVSNIKIRNNSSWFKKMNFKDVIKLMSSYTLGKIMMREDFRTRFEDKNSSISLHEIIYPLLQGYDSVMVDSDIEIGGTDQMFNNMVGRDLQEQRGKKAQGILCMPLLVGLDGVNKMSKSLKNYIGIQDPPSDMYGKTMSIPDSLLENYIDLTTSWSLGEKKINKDLIPNDTMGIKKKIAFNLVETYHSKEDAVLAAEYFINTFSKKELPIDIREFEPIEGNIVSVMVDSGLAPTKSEARRIILQNGVRVNEVIVSDPKFIVKESDVIQKGKRHFIKIK